MNAGANMSQIGERIAWVRTQVGLTQAELAKKAGVSQSTIASYECGDRKRPREILAIAKALEVDPYWLETGVASGDKHSE